MKNFIVMSAALILAVGFAEAKPRYDLEPDTVLFGIVPHQSHFYKDVVLKSVGDAPLRIDSIPTLGRYIRMPLSKKLLAPGDSVVIPLFYDSEYFVGERDRFPHIYTNAGRAAILAILSSSLDSIENLRPIYVKPYRIAASQFGDKMAKEFTFQIINNSSENVPLRLLYWDDEYYKIDFPAFVPPRDSAKGILTLNEKGIKTEFEKSITFEFITDLSERKFYSIPIARKIFKSQQQAPK